MDNVIYHEDAVEYVKKKLTVFDEIKNNQKKVKELIDEIELFNSKNGWVGIIYDLSEYVYGWYLKQNGDKNSWYSEDDRKNLEKKLSLSRS